MNQHSLVVSARATALLAGAMSIWLSCSQAHAQWLPDRNYTEGPGIRVGDLELHPGVAARGGYDNNVFRLGEKRVGSGIVAVSPHLNIKTLGKQRLTQGEDAAGSTSAPTLPPITFNAGLAGTLFYFTEPTAPTNVEFDTESVLSILPERVAGFDVGINYARATRPFTAYTGDNANNKYARDQIDPALTLRAQSRSGVLKGAISYSPKLTLYESDTFQYLNVANHGFGISSSWKFLPYTALVYDGGVVFSRYLDPVQSAATIALTDSDTFKTRLGLNGGITRVLSVRALIGYAVVNSKRPEFDDKEDVIGEAAFRVGKDTTSAEIGYQRDVQFSNLGGWLQQDRGYFRASFLFARMFALDLEGGAAHVNYGRLLDASGQPLGVDKDTGLPTTKREDLRLDGGVHTEYRATNWLAFSADFTVLANLTDFRYANVTVRPYPAQFTTLQAFGGVRVHY